MPAPRPGLEPHTIRRITYDEIESRLALALNRDPHKAEVAKIFFNVVHCLVDDTVLQERYEELISEIVNDYAAWEVEE